MQVINIKSVLGYNISLINECKVNLAVNRSHFQQNKLKKEIEQFANISCLRTQLHTIPGTH